MADEAEFVTLIDDEAVLPAPPTLPRWKVAIVDDDQGVHTGTRFVLQDFTLHGRGLELLSARSAAEARELFRANPDMAVILLDVVMETEGAGLELVQFVRKELKNETVRIILRTGQPGQAPERRVVVDYDINDYKAKTELTADKLFTTLTAALRSYEQLLKLVQTRRGLEIIIDAAATLFDQRSLQRLAEGVLTQLFVADGGGLRRHPGPARDRRRTALPCSPGRAATATTSRRTAPRRLSHLREADPRRVRQAAATISCRPLAPLYRHRQRPRAGGADGCGQGAFRHRPGAGGGVLQPACRRLRQRHALRGAGARQCCGWRRRSRGARRSCLAAKERLENQSERLKRANAFKGEVLGTVAHDLKNPLGVILGRAGNAEGDS